VSAASAIAALRAAGVRIVVRDGRLRVLGPREVVERVIALVREEIAVDPKSVVEEVRRPVLQELERVVADENRRHRHWEKQLAGRGVVPDLGAWLRDVAPDLLDRIRMAEGEIDDAVLAADEDALRHAVLRWRHRCNAARIGFEYFAGVREDE
jgi:hypothetical protein